MPGLVKVGYTLKDPDIRAKELGHTGAPLPYVVDYEALVDKPRDIEQTVHSKLSKNREGKEWSRCSLNDAINCIRDSFGKEMIFEKLRAADGLRNVFSVTRPRSKTVRPRAASVHTKNEYMATGLFATNCEKCGKHFEVTITRHDAGARCPQCFAFHDVSEFQYRFLGARMMHT